MKREGFHHYGYEDLASINVPVDDVPSVRAAIEGSSDAVSMWEIIESAREKYGVKETN